MVNLGMHILLLKMAGEQESRRAGEQESRDRSN